MAYIHPDSRRILPGRSRVRRLKCMLADVVADLGESFPQAFLGKGFGFVDYDFLHTRNGVGGSSAKLVYLRTIFMNVSVFAVVSGIFERSPCSLAAFFLLGDGLVLC